MTTHFSGFGSLWTAQSKYIIDFERGLVTHSKTLTKGQFNRLVAKQTAQQRPEFNPRQAFNYYTTYLIGQKFLLFLKHCHNNQILRISSQASTSYIFNHRDVFDKIHNQLVFPVVQMPYGGFVRTKLERDNIVKYVQKIQQKVNHYGMNFWNRNLKQKETAQRTYSTLKNIAFKPRQQPAPVEVTDQ